MMVSIVSLIVLFSATAMPGQSQSCSNVDWRHSFNQKGWSSCPSKESYIRGFYSTSRLGDDLISHLEQAHCCSKDVAFSNSSSQVVYADWLQSFHRNYYWSACPSGFFLQGLYRNSGKGGLWLIEDGLCSKPATHPRYYGDCFDHTVQLHGGRWSTCPPNYFVTGLYRSSCDGLSCITKFRCCQMTSRPPPLTSNDEVHTRVMDITMRDISYLAHYLGYGWCGGCRSSAVGEGFEKQDDTWVSDKLRRCEGYKADSRLSIKYNNWGYDLTNISYGEPVITELTPLEIDSGTVFNNDPSPSTHTISREEQVVRSVTHTTTDQWKSSHSFGFKLGYNPPSATGGTTASVSYDFNYETSSSTADSTGHEQTSTFKVNEEKTVPAYSNVRWSLVLARTRRTVAYTATVIPRFSAELRGFLRWGGGPQGSTTNYHRKFRGSESRPYFPYKFGSDATPFYRALKQESDQSMDPWLWMDMATAKPDVQEYINQLTNEKRYEFTLTGKFDDVSGHHVEVHWDEAHSTVGGGYFMISPAQHNETVSVIRAVAMTQAGDPPLVFPDPPEVRLDPGTSCEVMELMTNDV